ncbi:MAG: Xaa-Pro peptidase family protein [Bacteroidota bacterium]
MTPRRLEEVRRKLSQLKLQAIVITVLPHVRYLTGFTGSNGVCVVTLENQFFLTDGRYQEQIREEVQGFRPIVTSGSLFEAMKNQKVLAKTSRIGYESQHVSVSSLAVLQKQFPRHKFVPTASLVEEIASVKDPDEIESIKRAVQITDKVFEQLLGIIKEGIRENEVAAEIVYRHRKLGAEADAFEPIVASGVRGALPHARASQKVIQKGDMVTLDLGCRYRGYHSDLTRTVSVGAPSDALKRMYRVVRDAQEKALTSARSGMKAKSLDAIARKHIASQGLGKYFSHSLGHGLGLEVHELPRVSRLSKDTLKTGNVITVEPGVYVPGLGGVRIEDDVVILNGSCKVLNSSSKELIVL